MNCPNCGSPLSGTARFCEECGTPAPSPTTSAPQPTTPIPQPTPPTPAPTPGPASSVPGATSSSDPYEKAVAAVRDKKPADAAGGAAPQAGPQPTPFPPQGQANQAPHVPITPTPKPQPSGSKPSGVPFGLAIAALVMGVIGLLTFGVLGILSIVGLVLGIIALVMNRKSKQQGLHDPREKTTFGLSIAGIITNAIAVIIFIALLAIGIWAVGNIDTIETYGSSSSSVTASSSSSAKSSSSSVASSSSASSSSAASSSSSAAPSSSSTASSSTTVSGATQRIGNNYVGYLQVPDSWVDRTTEDFTPEQIDSYGMVYFVDPSTEFTSATLSHFAFAKAIQMKSYPATYDTVSADLYKRLQADPETYGDIQAYEKDVNGHKAYAFTSSLVQDGLIVVDIVVERDANSCVQLSCNCGASTNSVNEVLNYADTWVPA